MLDLFPSKLAQGPQFCNRQREKTLLHDNIQQARHTVLVAPRRYGKSSLVFKVVEEAALPFASIDLFLAYDDSTVTKRILSGIGNGISQIMSIDQKVLAKLQRIFINFRVSLTAGGFSIDAATETHALDPVDQVLSALKGLSELAKQQKKKIVVFIDEFQDIRESANAKAIQGAIRHIAQETHHIVFIFSGSNRRLLLELFDDKTQPLYMLCDMIQLDRMTSVSYLSHLQSLSKRKWGKELPIIVFEKIMPDRDAVFTAWQACFILHEDRLIAELQKLSTKQREILKTLAVHPSTEPTGQSFVMASKTPASTINQTIRVLLNADMIYKVKKQDPHVSQLQVNQVRVLDPLLSFALKKYQ